MSSSSSIDGLASGLDTTTIINNLMAAERVPVDLMTARKATAQSALDAYKSIETKLSAISTASAALEKSSGWDVRTATSSNTSVATATAADGAALGGIQFTVDRLAATHGVATATNSALTDVIAPSGSIQMTIGGSVHTISVGTGTLADVTAGINAAGLGVKAATVNTGSGYRLQITATKTGAAAAFTVDSGLNVGTVVTSQGVDAQLTFGTGPGAYAITSSTNTFSNVLPGVSITAGSVSAVPVSVDVKSDVGTLSDKVKSLVDALNSALSEIKTRTAYDPKSNTAASLAGDATARRATQELTRAVSDVIKQSSLGSPGLAGVSLDRNGNVTFDSAKFASAYASDPAAVQRLFVQGATTTGAVQFTSAGDRAQPGARSVVVTAPATKANNIGMVGAFPLTIPATIRIKIGTTEVVYSAGAGQTDAQTASGLQAAIDSAGLAVKVTASGGGLTAESVNYGSGATFGVDWGSGSYTTVAGTDAAGTIDGVAATGQGRQLTIPATNGQLSGLSVQLTSDATGAVGTVNYEPGLAQRISTVIAAATDSSTGYLMSAEAGKQSGIDLLTTSIDNYNVRLTATQARLKLQYAKLEVTLSTLKQTSTSLSSQINASSSSSG
ncbi:MAG: flagellar filament capping protein FliD [Acidimicrobiales bacterium]